LNFGPLAIPYDAIQRLLLWMKRSIWIIIE
jgi:hypothetical protein